MSDINPIPGPATTIPPSRWRRTGRLLLPALVVSAVYFLFVGYPPLRLLALVQSNAHGIDWQPGTLTLLTFLVLPIVLRIAAERLPGALGRMLAAVVMTWFGIAFAAIIVPLSILLVRDRPRLLGRGGAPPLTSARWNYDAAIRTPFFILLTLGYLFAMGAQVGGIAHLYNRAVGIAGLDTATLAVQALTLCSISGRFLGGFLVTRVPIRLYTLINLLGLFC